MVTLSYIDYYLTMQIQEHNWTIFFQNLGIMNVKCIVYLNRQQFVIDFALCL
jgi:hypothetical protein